MTAPTPIRFDDRRTVGAADIDLMGHVNNVVYLQWVQDIAAAHWQSAATPDQLAAVQWVAVRHEIDYKAPAFLGDEITVQTWVGSWTGATSDRRTRIVRPTDDVVLVEARTVWCAVDPASGRPRRVDEALRNRFLAR